MKDYLELRKQAMDKRIKQIEKDAIKVLGLKKPQSVSVLNSKYKDYQIKDLEYRLSIANYTIGALMIS